MTDEERKALYEKLHALGYQKYIFTFGCDQKHAGHCQPIYAMTEGEARARMFKEHGAEWCTDYNEADWKRIQDKPGRWWPMEIELDPIVVTPGEIEEI